MSAEVSGDTFDLARFVAAQAPVMDDVVAQLRAGRKASHWMWFVFPQLQGLGASSMARHYGIASLAEARAYLAHPLLGARLRHCCDLMLAVPDRSAHDILGSPDDLKFRSCLTLFALADPGEARFRAALQRFYDGEPDARTQALCAGG